MIEAGDRGFAAGMTGMGKSRLLGYYFATYPGQRLLIDVNDDYELGPAALDPENGGAETCRSPAELASALRTVRTIRYVPSTLEPTEYEELYSVIWAHARTGHPIFVWLDEAEGPTTAQRSPISLRLSVKQGRKKDLTHVSASLRPVDIEGALVDQSEHAWVFYLADEKDVARLARRLGLTAAALTEALAALPRFGFLYHRLGQPVAAFAPLDDRRLAITAQHVRMP